MTDNDNVSPTTRRRELGRRLRQYREAACLSVEAVAARMQTSTRTVSRWESGHSNIRRIDLGALLGLYEVPDHEADELTTFAQEARLPGWWTPYNSSLPPTYSTYLGLEFGAESLDEYNAVVIPGLLQTEEYMRAVLKAASPELDAKTIDARIGVRRQRQVNVAKRGTLRAHFIIDESVLRREVGGQRVMRQQIDYLLETMTAPLMIVHVLPFASSGGRSVLGSFAVLHIKEIGHVACIEMLGGATALGDSDDSRRYADHFNRLHEGALSEEASATLADQIKKRYHHG
jgi:transcriptional regulator with XRE-family HTH domain